ncbi:hypothetical protein HNY73_003326 [Argiope bruennichi]|uniref:Uncharacterized protein n=1 Tax=Argiope bruennichi TaxID=94029 RepID=A0A8T0FXK1_ARGBR|nr:hypothetical protein HNY73_003326 [Argiope bruennichi]
MRTLADARVTDKLLKSLWIQRLPVRVQEIVAVSSDSLDLLSEIADKIAVVSESAGEVQECSSSAVTNDSLQQQIAALQEAVQQLTRKQEGSKYSRPRRSNSKGLSRKYPIPSLVKCVGVWPCKSSLNKVPDPNFPLYATNETRIPTFSCKEFILDFDLRRLFSWSFFLANVKKLVLGAGLLTDINNCRFIDRLTSVLGGSSSHGPSLGLKSVSDSSPYHKLLNQFPSLTNQPSVRLTTGSMMLLTAS